MQLTKEQHDVIELTNKEISLLLFILQDYWSKDINNIKTRNSILKKLR